MGYVIVHPNVVMVYVDTIIAVSADLIIFGTATPPIVVKNGQLSVPITTNVTITNIVIVPVYVLIIMAIFVEKIARALIITIWIMDMRGYVIHMVLNVELVMVIVTVMMNVIEVHVEQIIVVLVV
tara:strand:- start:1376 stop:1750 length:375 start_codon:yes stop_codon:yes gene_type:complete